MVSVEITDLWVQSGDGTEVTDGYWYSPEGYLSIAICFNIHILDAETDEDHWVMFDSSLIKWNDNTISHGTWSHNFMQDWGQDSWATITIWWDFGPLANPGFYEGDSFKVQVVAYCLSNADGGVKGVVSASPERFIRFFGAKAYL